MTGILCIILSLSCHFISPRYKQATLNNTFNHSRTVLFKTKRNNYIIIWTSCVQFSWQLLLNRCIFIMHLSYIYAVLAQSVARRLGKAEVGVQVPRQLSDFNISITSDYLYKTGELVFHWLSLNFKQLLFPMILSQHFRIKQNRKRTIIDQTHFHFCSKATRLYDWHTFSYSLQLYTHITDLLYPACPCLNKTRPIPFYNLHKA